MEDYGWIAMKPVPIYSMEIVRKVQTFVTTSYEKANCSDQYDP